MKTFLNFRKQGADYDYLKLENTPIQTECSYEN